MPSKRVSLKGKGADLFFGDYSPGEQAPSSNDGDESDSLSTDNDAALRVSADLRPTQSVSPSIKPLSSLNESQPVPRPTRASQTAKSSTRASKLASTSAEPLIDTIESIRKVVKVPGKEVSFTRLTPEEKAQIADIVYTYKRQGQKTTENEINRIALNFLLDDYHKQGPDSVLAQVLAALLA